MDSGSVAGERPKRTPGRQRLLPFGCGVQARPGVSPLPGGRRWLRLRGRAARASPLLLVLLVPSPRLAATAPRRTLAERTRPGHAVAAVALGAGRNAQGRLPLGVGRVAALASSRRGEAGGRRVTQVACAQVARMGGHPLTACSGLPLRTCWSQGEVGKVLEVDAQACRSEGSRSGNEGMVLRFDMIPNCIDSFLARCHPFGAWHFTSCLG